MTSQDTPTTGLWCRHDRLQHGKNHYGQDEPFTVCSDCGKHWESHISSDEARRLAPRERPRPRRPRMRVHQDTPAAGREDDAARKTLQAVLTWAEQRCPCKDEQPDPCTLCGATVAEGICLSAENTIPSALLTDIRFALARRACAPALQPNAPEPVVWQTQNKFGHPIFTYDKRLAGTWQFEGYKVHPLYGAPPQPPTHASDIVTRLRAYRVLADRGGITSEVADPLMIEAADEIERLHKANEMLEISERYWISEAEKARAEQASTPSRVGAMETPQQLLQKADALFHDRDGDHAGWAHALLHQAAAHLSDSEEIRGRAAQETPRMLDALREVAPSRGFREGILGTFNRDDYGPIDADGWMRSKDGTHQRREITGAAQVDTRGWGIGYTSVAQSVEATALKADEVSVRSRPDVPIRAEAGEPPRDDGWEPIALAPKTRTVWTYTRTKREGREFVQKAVWNQTLWMNPDTLTTIYPQFYWRGDFPLPPPPELVQ